MSDYNFEYESLYDMIRDLEHEVESLKDELRVTNGAVYGIQERLDSMDQTEYTINNTPTTGDL